MASSGNTWCKKLMAKSKRYALRHTKKRFASDLEQNKNIKTVREYHAPVLASYVPKRRGSGCRLSHEKRALILAKAEARMVARRELFASLGVSI